MSAVTVTQRITAFNDYIALVPNRDRVMSVVQFVCMTLADPAARAGCPKLSRDLKTILSLAAQYRAITRFSQWLVVGPMLTPRGMRDVVKSSPCRVTGVLKIIYTAFFALFLIGEEINLFAKYGILSKELGQKWNRSRFVFIFWANVARTAANILVLRRSAYDPVKDAKNNQHAKDRQRKVLSVWDGVLQTMFAYGLLKNAVPAGPQHMRSAFRGGSLVDLVTSFAPPVEIVPNTLEGIIGLVASVPGFKMSVL